MENKNVSTYAVLLSFFFFFLPFFLNVHKPVFKISTWIMLEFYAFGNSLLNEFLNIIADFITL